MKHTTTTTLRLFTIACLIGCGLPKAQPTNLIAIMPAEGHFLTVLQGIRSELGDNYHIEIVNIENSLKIGDVARMCKAMDARAFILMDSKAISIALDLEKYDTCFLAMRKFVLMTLMVQWSARGLHTTAGIQFEVPAYTLVTNFRIISQKDFRTVGVFYRKQFRGMVDEAKKLLAREQIVLHAVCVDDDRKGAIGPQDALKNMKHSFDDMIKKNKVEVIWLIADNVLVNSNSLVEFWLSKVKGKNIPVVAPLETIAGRQIGAAIFAADPDYLQLGVQAANQITQVYEGNLSMDEIGFEPTISIKSTLNVDVAKDIGWALRQEKLVRVSKIIKK